MAPWLSNTLIFAAVALDLLVAISIPFFPTLNLYIVGVSFSNLATTTTPIFQNSVGPSFSGQINSIPVQNVTDLQLGLWAACFIQGQSSILNTTCFPASFGYKVVLQDTTGLTVNVVETAWTGALFFEALAGAVSLVAIFTKTHAKHYMIIGGAIALTAITGIVEFALFTSVSKVAPVLGSQVRTLVGPGFVFIIVSFLLLPFSWWLAA